MSAAEAREYNASKAALAEIDKHVNSFPVWAKTCDRSDPLIAELYPRYYADFARSIHVEHSTLVKTILRCAKRHKVRFLSITRHDLITFEDISYPAPYSHGWPVAWHIARVCGIAWGAGNSSQHQIDLKYLPTYHIGTYDIRGKSPMMVGVCVGNSWELVKKRYNDLDSVASYLRTCDVRPIEPAIKPYFGSVVPDDLRMIRMDFGTR